MWAVFFYRSNFHVNLILGGQRSNVIDFQNSDEFQFGTASTITTRLVLFDKQALEIEWEAACDLRDVKT